MEDGLNGKNGAPVQQNVVKVHDIGQEVVADQSLKNLDMTVRENLYKLMFVM